MGKKINVATNIRGFLNHLFNAQCEGFKFINVSQGYEIAKFPRLKKTFSRILKSRFLNPFGYFSTIKVNDNLERDIDFSYNKFLITNKPYIIYLETPIALVNYSLNTLKKSRTKAKLKKRFHDKNLKSIVCLSKKCFETLYDLYDIPKDLIVEQIYPYIPNQPSIKISQTTNKIKLLYISSNFYLKGGFELIELFKTKNMSDFHLTIITKVKNIRKKDLEFLTMNHNITIKEFDLDYKNLTEIYRRNDVYINMTRMDSFPMVLLEASNFGNAIITNDIFSISEVVIDGITGFTTQYKYLFYNKDGKPNPSVWNHRSKTIYEKKAYDDNVSFLYEKLMFYKNNRDILDKHKSNSYNHSNEIPFNNEYVLKQWKALLDKI